LSRSHDEVVKPKKKPAAKPKAAKPKKAKTPKKTVAKKPAAAKKDGLSGRPSSFF
jgi:cell division septation protein DedD